MSNSLYKKLSAELDVLDKKKNRKSLLQKFVRKVRKYYYSEDELEKIDASNKSNVYSKQHNTLLRRVKKMEADMIKEGNKE